MDFPSSAILHALLDILNFGILALDENSKPVFTNSKATRHIGEGRVFYTDHKGALRVAAADADKRLREHVQRPLRTSRHGCFRPFPIHDGAEGPRVLFAWIGCLQIKGGVASQPPRHRIGQKITSVIITEKKQAEIEDTILADLFSLTPAESRLLQCLLQGASPSDYAARKGVSQNTVRNQLKSIFEKTSVRRQTDLINLVATCLAPVEYDISTGG